MLAKLASLGLSKLVVISGAIILVAGAGTIGYIKSQPAAPTEESKLSAENQPSPTPSLLASPTVASTSKARSLITPLAKNTARSKNIAINPTPTAEPSPSPSLTKESDDQPPLLLKGIGINLDYYDPTTGKAGDLVFTKGKLQFDVLFTEFGFVIPGSQSSTQQDKSNPQPTWQAPLGTKVQAIVDGVVTNVGTLYSGDYTIMVATDTKSRWQYETEHVTNPLVKVGDRVKAGQVIAEVSPHNKEGNGGYGLVEIGILKGGNPPQHLCPFAYLDPSVKDDIQKKLLAFYKAWEDYKGNTSLYNESAQPTPGCLTLNPIDG